ncbi:cytochrome c [Limnoglobus roseus]|uniref:Cytochrome c n=1 Tax=Limnoglobus roseus TaxID=2598579 RepID=A0A5C1A912_9BACT|nr:cytochrome c [Limnoglobus roseus]QEL13598.1 hypothetical protein PX52LOC_00456 [Limnoglobus roseus]
MKTFARVSLLVLLAAFCGFLPGAVSQVPNKPVANPPKLEAVAETKLLMAGLAKANFDGLNRTFQEKPADAQTWAFARGQSLLIAETGNLLMMRPPKTRQAQDTWMAKAADLREAGVKLAKAAAGKDYAAARAGVASMANACNRCHEAFRVAERVVPLE